MTKNSTGIVT